MENDERIEELAAFMDRNTAQIRHALSRAEAGTLIALMLLREQPEERRREVLAELKKKRDEPDTAIDTRDAWNSVIDEIESSL